MKKEKGIRNKCRRGEAGKAEEKGRKKRLERREKKGRRIKGGMREENVKGMIRK